MTTDYLYELQKTIITTLKADATLSAMVNGVYSNLPGDAKYPCIALENIAARDLSTKTARGFNVGIDIKILSRARESQEALNVLAEIRRILDGASLAPSGCVVTSIREFNNHITRLADGVTWSASIGFIVILQEGSGFVGDGNDFIIKIGNGATPTEVFTTIGGLRKADISIANRLVDCSNISFGKWRKLVSGAGIASVSVSGAGFFTDSAAEETMRARAFSGIANNYEILLGNNDKISGSFIVSAYKRNGNMDAVEEFIVALESAGEVSFA